MAKFFQSFDEEKQETQSKAKEIVERSQEKLSKRDLKFKELKDKITEAKNAGKNFEKNFKKFINEAKKYSSYFENGEVPNFLVEFLEDSRIVSSKPMQALATEFLNLFNKPAEVVISKKVSKKKGKSLDTILLLENDKEKEIVLVEYLEKDLNDMEMSEVYIALFSIYSRMKKPLKMIEFLKKMDLNLENPFMKNVVKNLDVYLGKIANLIDQNEQQEFLDLLIYLKNSNFPIDQSIVEKRELEIDFFVFGRCPNNMHPMFYLLFLIRQNQWNESLEYFKKNENIFDNSKSSLMILIELGRLAAQNQEFQLAFDILFRCSKSEFYSAVKVDLFSLCVILNEKLIGHDFFMEFIEEFKKFEANMLCLASHDASVEACRAFYFLNSLDFENSSLIIEKTSGFKAREELKVQATKIYQSMLKSESNN